MATLHLTCGLPGSGKTALAKRLEAELPALRLCPDEWMGSLFGDGYNEHGRAAVERLQLEIAERALVLGVDAILEFGFWSRGERDAVRRRALAVGAEVKLHYLEAPKEELKKRLRRRNASLPSGAFRVSEADLDLWWEMFEPPDTSEAASAS